MAVDHRPHEISLVPPLTISTFRSPYAGESFEAASRFFTSSMAFTPIQRARLSLDPLRVT